MPTCSTNQRQLLVSSAISHYHHYIRNIFSVGFAIPLGSVNEYQLRLGRQRQVWFMSLADECQVCR